MKKLFVLAMSAMMVMSVSAQEAKKERVDGKKAKIERAELRKEHRDFQRDARDFRKNHEFRGGERQCLPQGEMPPFSKEEMLEFKIKRLSEELFLDSVQEEAFAKTYREFAKEREKLWEEMKSKDEKLRDKFAKEFGKTLNDKQVKHVLRPEGPCCHKGPKSGCDKGPKPGCGKGPKPGCDKGPRPEGPRE